MTAPSRCDLTLTETEVSGIIARGPTARQWITLEGGATAQLPIGGFFERLYAIAGIVTRDLTLAEKTQVFNEVCQGVALDDHLVVRAWRAGLRPAAGDPLPHTIGLIQCGRLYRQGRPADPGTTYSWSHNGHRYGVVMGPLWERWEAVEQELGRELNIAERRTVTDEFMHGRQEHEILRQHRSAALTEADRAVVDAHLNPLYAEPEPERLLNVDRAAEQATTLIREARRHRERTLLEVFTELDGEAAQERPAPSFLAPEASMDPAAWSREWDRERRVVERANRPELRLNRYFEHNLDCYGHHLLPTFEQMMQETLGRWPRTQVGLQLERAWGPPEAQARMLEDLRQVGLTTIAGDLNTYWRDGYQPTALLRRVIRTLCETAQALTEAFGMSTVVTREEVANTRPSVGRYEFYTALGERLYARRGGLRQFAIHTLAEEVAGRVERRLVGPERMHTSRARIAAQVERFLLETLGEPTFTPEHVTVHQSVLWPMLEERRSSGPSPRWRPVESPQAWNPPANTRMVYPPTEPVDRAVDGSGETYVVRGQQDADGTVTITGIDRLPRGTVPADGAGSGPDAERSSDVPERDRVAEANPYEVGPRRRRRRAEVTPEPQATITQVANALERLSGAAGEARRRVQEDPFTGQPAVVQPPGMPAYRPTPGTRVEEVRLNPWDNPGGGVHAVRRGCGTRVARGIYVEAERTPQGNGWWQFLVDPATPWPERMPLPRRGVVQFEDPRRSGVWHLVDYVGLEHYPTPAHFVEEFERHGISRRLPGRGIDYSLIGPESILFLVHAKARVENWYEFGPYPCPCGREEHHPHANSRQQAAVDGDPGGCVGVWWHTFKPGRHARRNGEEFGGCEGLTVETPWGGFKAWTAPESAPDPIYGPPALFLRVRATSLAVIRDPRDPAAHRENYQIAGASALPVRECDR